MFDMKDLILEGVVYTIMGIVIVFAMLVVIMIVIKAMQLFSGAEAPQKKEAPAPVKQEEISPAPENKQNDNNEELIAVITAAVAAAMGKSSSGFIIKSYKKLSGSEWNKIGRREALDNRF